MTGDMRIGIDIGGTHTDGALLEGGQVLAVAKTLTEPENLLASIERTLRILLEGRDPAAVRSLNLSTTLSTNAIITGTTDPVGVLVAGGPGIDPQSYRIGDYFHQIHGSIDHLGNETAKLDAKGLEAAIGQCLDQGVHCFAVASKFSPHNPSHEQAMRRALGGRADFVSSGHLVSGRLNFGRRIHTAYYNAAVWHTFRTFAQAFTEALRTFALRAEVSILKADGGTMPLKRAMDLPVQSIFSGPAASVMGILATSAQESDFLMIDIGGTTSDIALFANGQPLLEREGIAIDGRPTLVRAVRVLSIGIGGDSLISVENGEVRTGPLRVGPSLAAGGPAPALMDACNVLGLAHFGDTERSLQGLRELASRHGLVAAQAAEKAVDAALSTLERAINKLVDEVNAKPVYTIHEILEERTIRPQKIIAIGGPAQVLKGRIQARMGLEVQVPPRYEVCNAIGAALARTTTNLGLNADTARGRLSVPMLDIFRNIPRSYTLKEAVAEARKLLLDTQRADGAELTEEDIQTIQADAFNMVEGSYTAGKNIRVAVQVRPAVLGHVAPGGPAGAHCTNVP